MRLRLVSMLFYITLLLGIVQIVMQAFAAYFSYKIYLFNRINKVWLAVTFALIIMTFRRITAFMIEINYLSAFRGSIADLDRIILPTLISVLLLYGLWAMYKNFENYEVVEKKVRDKIKHFRKR